MFDQINSYVARYVQLTEEEIVFFNSMLELKTVPKKTMLLKEGEVCSFEAYVNKGCIRNYYIDENGAEVILQFAIEDWWTSDIASFHYRTPSIIFIETLEACELLTISLENKEAILTKIPKLERMFRLMLQKNLASLQYRFIKSITSSAQEKYIDFLERYPTIPQRVAQHYIASYLGISPEFLSKVRAKLLKK